MARERHFIIRGGMKSKKGKKKKRKVKRGIFFIHCIGSTHKVLKELGKCFIFASGHVAAPDNRFSVR